MSESLNRDSKDQYLTHSLLGMKLNPSKTQIVIVNRSRTINVSNPDLCMDGTHLVTILHPSLLCGYGQKTGDTATDDLSSDT